jgi:hypothetical protein
MRSLRTLAGLLLLAGPAAAGPPDPQLLADRIDARLDAHLLSKGVPPAPPADDAEFLRRAALDLTGRVPTPREVYAFLADPSPDKRSTLVDELTDTPRYASHAAAVWRAALAPETTAVPEARLFRAGFEAWLRVRFRENATYDALVRELLTAPLSPDPDNPTPALRKPDAPNPLAFYAVKDAKPENLAAATARVFLGVQIECAQCHDHPFAKWTRDQFWNQAAFFAGVERSGDGMFAPIAERPAVRDIRAGDTSKRVEALFLDEESPGADTSPRAALAGWVTARGNPYFARSAVNRVWGRMFGRGVVDPVDDFHDNNPPSHPELLDELATAFADAGYDLRYLVRAIGRTKAYRRTSARTDPGQDDPKLFAKMAVKALTGEQLYDSLVLATGVREGGGRASPRDQFLARFAPGGKPSEPETSIPQALALMNGRVVADAAAGPAVTAAAELPGLTPAERVETLYLSALGRRPTAKELDRALNYVEAGGRDRLGDVFWALLNSAEFRMNH